MMGHLTQDEWINGPTGCNKACTFIPVDDFIPSRFVLAYDDNLDVCFVGLDAERIGETANDGTFCDFGDNATRYKVDCSRIDYNEADVNESDLEDDDDNDNDDNDDTADVNNNDESQFDDNAMLSSAMQRFLCL